VLWHSWREQRELELEREREKNFYTTLHECDRANTQRELERE